MQRALGTPYLWPVVALALVVAIRMATPSDLGGHDDQSKTLACTADVVRNGQWILPRDGAGFRTMKPPMVNWLGALLPALGLWDEWALKFPSVLAAALAVALTVGMARGMMLAVPVTDPRSGGPSGDGAARQGRAAHASWATAAGAAAGVILLAGEDTMKHAYFLRPDMLNMAFLTAGWSLATVALGGRASRPRAVQAGLWLAVAAAFLTKGPTALIPVLYLFLAARLLHGRWSAVERAGWRWGLPLALSLFGAWLLLAYRVDPAHVTHELIGTETVARVTGGLSVRGWALQTLGRSWEIPLWMVQRFYPWPVLALAALLLIGARRWFRHPLGPAILWVLVVTAFFAPVWRRTAAYVLPAYPAVACLAVYALAVGIGRVRLRPAGVAAVGIVMIVALGVLRDALHFETRAGDHQKAFVQAARPLVGDDPVAFVGIRDSSLITLFGLHQAGDASPAALAAARWVVRPLQSAPAAGDGDELVLTSGLVRGPRRGHEGGRQILGLYRRAAQPSRSRQARAGRP